MSKIRRMLNKCASGYSIEGKKHRQWVRYNGKTYLLSKGAHDEKDPEIQKGEIKQMVRHLEIDEKCAERHLEILR